MITKFNSASIPSFVREGEFTTGVLAWWVTIGINEYRLYDGDYIVQDDNGVPIRYIPAADYAPDLVLQNLVREEVGRDLIRAIWASLNASALSASQKAGVASTISPVMVMIITGEIVSGRFLANSTATNANYTAGVKTALLNLMDQHIAKL